MAEFERPPLPTPSELTQPFWDAAVRRVLVRPVCDVCRVSFFTPQVVCPACGSEAWSYEPSVGTGSVHTFTVVHRPPSPAFCAPYVLADVDVDDGWNLLTNIEGCDSEQVHVGMRVRVRWRQLDDRITLPVFGPEGVSP